MHEPSTCRCLGGLVIAVFLSAAPVFAGTTTKASVATGGEQSFCGDPNILCYSISPAISADGRFVSYSSVSSNLVPGLHNGSPQIYLHDRLACTTIRVTRTSTGGPANFNSTASSLSGDGRYVVYESSATNILPGVNSGVRQIYLFDRITEVTTLVSASTGGLPGNGDSGAPTMTPDGRYIVFQSGASNLVPGDTNGLIDIFVHDRQTGSTVRVNVTDAGEQASSSGGPAGGHSRRPTIAANGRYVAYDSSASNLSNNPDGHFRVYLHDRDANDTGIFDEPGGFSSDLVSVSSKGVAANAHSTWPSITDDGRLIAFISDADNLGPGISNNVLDVFVHDRMTSQTVRESVGPEGQQGSFLSFFPRLSADGMYLTFHSRSPQFLGGGFPLNYTHIVRRDRMTGELEVLSVNTQGEWATSTSEYAVMTPNGQTFAFSSTAENLVPDHPHSWADVYVRSLQPADINNDGVVDVSDLLLLLAHWGQSCSMANLTGDGSVDVSDLLVLLANWG